jgi:hypothetical protein
MPPRAADRARVQRSLESWPLVIPGYSALGAGSAAPRFFAEEASDDRVA